ncbi:MAG: pantoate--beta-alanine ligase [Candidatus Muiribacterium halophilum]|uniref:Pantothenate synthetase n=1 Tax=Muiribacterium halophilum TaxID=2053465 RepID=A0A2N5ZHF7_MUIH1|nr:MAG: pantoate--beta-alanine ligase [Candidatus Muirbacterium halophilum]
MHIFKDVKSYSKWRESIDTSVGFVPTMGCLHAGHSFLVQNSVKENENTVVSIFVNPTQFGPNEDFEKYPRTIDDDIRLLEETGCSAVFLPYNKMMYDNPKVFVDVDELDEMLCGEKRPGHFKGVLTVVAKLFNIIRPTRAYFGEKDYQQFVIINKMVKDLFFELEMRMIPIVREKDGLALSSRNRYLCEEHRKHAVILSEIIRFAQENCFEGMKITEAYKMIRNKFLENIPDFMKVDYVDIRNGNDFRFEDNITRDSRIFLAIYCGETRLIDNGKIL